jgi:hypothetical protein
MMLSNLPAAVKTAAVKTLFDYRYLGKIRNRQFGAGIEAPVIADKPGADATDREYAEFLRSTRFTAEEMRLSRNNGITLEVARQVLQDFDAFLEDRELERLEAMSSADEDAAEDAMIAAMVADHDSDESNRYEEAELSEVGMMASIVDEGDFARPAPRRHRRVDAAKARRMAVAGR